jgi:hypothetical protein
MSVVNAAEATSLYRAQSSLLNQKLTLDSQNETAISQLPYAAGANSGLSQLSSLFNATA